MSDDFNRAFAKGMTDQIKRAFAIGQIMNLREEISRLLDNPAISENESRLKSVAHADLKLASVLTELKNALTVEYLERVYFKPREDKNG